MKNNENVKNSAFNQLEQKLNTRYQLENKIEESKDGLLLGPIGTFVFGCFSATIGPLLSVSWISTLLGVLSVVFSVLTLINASIYLSSKVQLKKINEEIKELKKITNTPEYTMVNEIESNVEKVSDKSTTPHSYIRPKSYIVKLNEDSKDDTDSYNI